MPNVSRPLRAKITAAHQQPKAPMTESQIISAILLRFGSHPDLRMWRSQPIAAHDRSGRVIRALPRGHADISGVLAPHGRAFYLEAKSATGKQRPEQKAFELAVTSRGAIYAVVRSLDDVAKSLGLTL